MPSKGLQAEPRHLLRSDWPRSQQWSHLLSTAQCLVNTLSRTCGEKEPIWSAALTASSLTMASCDG